MGICWIHTAWMFGPFAGPALILFGIIGGLLGMNFPFFIDIPLALFCWVGVAKILKLIIPILFGFIPESVLDLFVKFCWFGAIVAIFFSLNCDLLHIID